MARYKPYVYAQAPFIPIRFSKQILPDSFEYNLNHLIDHKPDISLFNDRFINDEIGSPAINPKVLLKRILYGYFQTIVSCRNRGRGPSRKCHFYGPVSRPPTPFCLHHSENDFAGLSHLFKKQRRNS